MHQVINVSFTFQKFNLFIKNEFDDGTKLTAYLKKIDEHLESLDGKFLAGNTICYADCHFMPRLQHLRIAGAVSTVLELNYCSMEELYCVRNKL